MEVEDRYHSAADLQLEIDRLLLELEVGAMGDYVRLDKAQDALLDLRAYVVSANVAS